MGEKTKSNNKIGQSHFFDLITSDELSWQGIIYDLIKTEQLDPWDIDICLLAERYLEVIDNMEDGSFLISSKVLLACSLLLRLKSEILINNYIQDLNEILSGKRKEKKYEYERIEIDENELPVLVPHTPMPRFRKVTLEELMSSLNQAIETENRRIRKEIKVKQAEKSALVVLPRKNRVPLKSRIRIIYLKIKDHLKHPDNLHMKYSVLAPTRGEKIASFLPVLHLSNEEKLWLHQKEHFDEIHMHLEKLEEEFQEMNGLVEGVDTRP